MKKRNKKPLVSVLTPLYNAEKYILKQMNSVLGQSYENIEFIIVDDCGNDNSVRLVLKNNDERIIIKNNIKNIGIVKSTNEALKIAKGKYIVFLDDDEIIPFDRIESQVSYLEANPSIGLVIGKTVNIDENDNYLNEINLFMRRPDELRAMLLFQNYIGNGATMVRREVIEKNNIIFQEESYGMQDYLFYTKLSKITKFSMINQIALFHRLHEENASKKISNNYKNNRSKCYAENQKWLLEKNGFFLDDKEIRTFTKCYCENINSKIDSENIKEVITILKKLDRMNQEKNTYDAMEFRNVLRFQLYRLINSVGYDSDDDELNMAVSLIMNEKYYRNFTNININRPNIIIIGSGLFFQNRIFSKIFEEVNLIGLHDNDINKHGKCMFGLLVEPVENIIKKDYDYCIIMSSLFEDIKSQIIGLGVPKEKILSYVEFSQMDDGY